MLALFTFAHVRCDIYLCCSKDMKYVNNDSYIVVGKPSPLYNDTDTDWAPTLNLGHEKSKNLPTPVRGVRLRERKEKRKRVDVARSLLSLRNSKDQGEDITEGEVPVPVPESSSCEEETGTVVQTELCGETIFSMGKELNRLTVENMTLKEQITRMSLSEDTFKDDDEKVKLFTGLPSYAVLNTLFTYVFRDIKVR